MRTSSEIKDGQSAIFLIFIAVPISSGPVPREDVAFFRQECEFCVFGNKRNRHTILGIPELEGAPAAGPATGAATGAASGAATGVAFGAATGTVFGAATGTAIGAATGVATGVGISLWQIFCAVHLPEFGMPYNREQSVSSQHWKFETDENRSLNLAVANMLYFGKGKTSGVARK
jgi:hypothetical protein